MYGAASPSRLGSGVNHYVLHRRYSIRAIQIRVIRAPLQKTGLEVRW